MPLLSKTLDWISVMAYDYHGQWDKRTGHVAPMYSHPDDFDATFNAVIDRPSFRFVIITLCRRYNKINDSHMYCFPSRIIAATPVNNVKRIVSRR